MRLSRVTLYHKITSQKWKQGRKFNSVLIPATFLFGIWVLTATFRIQPEGATAEVLIHQGNDQCLWAGICLLRCVAISHKPTINYPYGLSVNGRKC